MKAIKICVMTALTLLTMSVYADTSSIVGNYKCQRTDPTSNAVSYPLGIKATGTTYTLEWDSDNGYPAMYGTGVMNPTTSNLIAVSFLDAKDPNNYGIELFQVKPDGSLQANWTVQSTTQVGTETCTKNK